MAQWRDRVLSAGFRKSGVGVEAKQIAQTGALRRIGDIGIGCERPAGMTRGGFILTVQHTGGLDQFFALHLADAPRRFFLFGLVGGVTGTIGRTHSSYGLTLLRVGLRNGVRQCGRNVHNPASSLLWRNLLL